MPLTPTLSRGERVRRGDGERSGGKRGQRRVRRGVVEVRRRGRTGQDGHGAGGREARPYGLGANRERKSPAPLGERAGGRRSAPHPYLLPTGEGEGGGRVAAEVEVA